MFSLFSLFPTFIIFTDFFDNRVLLPSDASPSQCPSGLAKAISPKLLSTVKHGYEHDKPPSHEHIANQELSFHTSVIDMTISAPPMYSLGLQINPFASGSQRKYIEYYGSHSRRLFFLSLIGEVYGSKQYKKKSLRLDKINSKTTKPCKNWHIRIIDLSFIVLLIGNRAYGKNPYTENANTSYYPAVLTFSYVRKLVFPPMTKPASYTCKNYLIKLVWIENKNLEFFKIFKLETPYFIRHGFNMKCQIEQYAPWLRIVKIDEKENISLL
ncbi:hypothetical protein PHYBLDRAFT_172068 [Phycomyces blakesleeanus NRRL 1555(-)]|uniref:Uncharacterized protein n=1 Tax=Phycomyces blakesleeanus (strain ATCC 8743b / DSM 1359 / FGSC 10004 / NBRC 33097 / NRRL 1555) TaxID=763407 RepID=A0A162TPJ2_PHYB8|nr:hypothetical protein PHYBLDRAFT_172068 [Phycomyces blakesleeanus NRRL 1555(-)]OAD70052.1 hypothetical protein PHYBLDRAFT_172068 [Phycomyces blakesleeanus NRRL 1555(-)]|eukprot:XP_018288092.1 hypothetical protein PHYBLDRAFT_172068 [Phycomyces blakesleeanus NRRL 1555(-)]